MRPLNVDLGTDIFGRQKETLIVMVVRNDRNDRSLFVWGHSESMRNEICDWTTMAESEYDIEFLEPDQETTFSPATSHRVTFRVGKGADALNTSTKVTYQELDANQ